MTATQPSASNTPLEHVPSTGHEVSIHGPALTGWQSHQSHGQLTIVFYVDLGVRSEDIEVIIASTYVIAGIRGYEPVVKARLYARIDPTTSYWQLERPAHQHRSRTRSRTTSGGEQSSSGHEAGPSNDIRGATGQPSRATISQRRSSRHDNGSGSGSGSGSNDSAPSPEQRRHSSRPASPVPSTGSYELLQRSIASLNTSSSSGDPSGSGTTSSQGDPFQRAANAERGEETRRTSLISPPSHTSLRSYGADSNEQFGVASLQSSQVLGSTTSVSQQSSGDAGSELTARLLTVHLTKIDGGMWPLLVSGPAPLVVGGNMEDDEGTATGLDTSSQSTLQGALSEALQGETESRGNTARLDRRAPSGDPSSSVDDDDDLTLARRYRLSAAESTLSFQSDDSQTVMARRRTSIEDAARDDAKFNMDPVSLALIGYQTKSASVARPGPDEAFEYFVRSWRKADLPVATRVLVQEYLPLIPEESQSGGDTGTLQSTARSASHRPRMIAALGGRTALARLYVSYARLSLSNASNAHRRSSLFPWGSGHTRNPYQPHGQYSTSAGFVRAPRSMAHYASPPGSPSSAPSSPRSGGDEGSLSEAQLILRFGPLAYLDEARKIDASIQIASEEREEAQAIAEEARLELEAEEEEKDAASGNIFFTAARSGATATGASVGVGAAAGSGRSESSEVPTSPSSGGGAARRRKRKKRSARTGKEAKSASGLSSPPSASRAADEGGLIALLGGAAVFSVVVAGSVAALGWWRRGGGGGAGGG